MARLGDIFTISSGGTPDKRQAKYYENGTIPWVKTGDLKEKYVSHNIERITQEGLDNSSAKLFPADTVLVAMYGATIGACSILGFEASTNQACAAFLPTSKVLPDYLYYFLQSKKDISSTYEDLQDERKEVMQALLELDCIPAGMELFPASNDDQWTLIKRVIDALDELLVQYQYKLHRNARFGGLEDFSNIHISQESFNLIRVQFKALGMICLTPKRKNGKFAQTYWSLTPYGDYIMTQLLAIRQ